MSVLSGRPALKCLSRPERYYVLPLFWVKIYILKRKENVARVYVTLLKKAQLLTAYYIELFFFSLEGGVRLCDGRVEKYCTQMKQKKTSFFIDFFKLEEVYISICRVIMHPVRSLRYYELGVLQSLVRNRGQ